MYLAASSNGCCHLNLQAGHDSLPMFHRQITQSTLEIPAAAHEVTRTRLPLLRMLLAPHIEDTDLDNIVNDTTHMMLTQ